MSSGSATANLRTSVEPDASVASTFSEVVFWDFVAVLVTSPLNLTAVDRAWFKNSELFKIDANAQLTLAGGFVHVVSSQFQIWIVPDRVQIAVTTMEREIAPNLLLKLLHICVGAFPGTEIKALGFNLGAILPNPLGKNMEDLSRQLFCPPRLAKAQFAADNKILFGTSFRFVALGFTVNASVDAKIFEFPAGFAPPQGFPVKPGIPGMYAIINFHRDLQPGDKVSDYVDRWKEVLDLTRQITSALS